MTIDYKGIQKSIVTGRILDTLGILFINKLKSMLLSPKSIP